MKKFEQFLKGKYVTYRTKKGTMVKRYDPRSKKKKESGGLLDVLLDFFGMKDKKKAEQTVKKVFEENKKDLNISYAVFQNYLGEYLKNKEKWDKKFSSTSKKKKEKLGDSKKEKSKIKPKKAGKKILSYNTALMKKIAGIVNQDMKDYIKDNKESKESDIIDIREPDKLTDNQIYSLVKESAKMSEKKLKRNGDLINQQIEMEKKNKNRPEILKKLDLMGTVYRVAQLEKDNKMSKEEVVNLVEVGAELNREKETENNKEKTKEKPSKEKSITPLNWSKPIKTFNDLERMIAGSKNIEEAIYEIKQKRNLSPEITSKFGEFMKKNNYKAIETIKDIYDNGTGEELKSLENLENVKNFLLSSNWNKTKIENFIDDIFQWSQTVSEKLKKYIEKQDKTKKQFLNEVLKEKENLKKDKKRQRQIKFNEKLKKENPHLKLESIIPTEPVKMKNITNSNVKSSFNADQLMKTKDYFTDARVAIKGKPNFKNFKEGRFSARGEEQKERINEQLKNEIFKDVEKNNKTKAKYVKTIDGGSGDFIKHIYKTKNGEYVAISDRLYRSAQFLINNKNDFIPKEIKVDGNDPTHPIGIYKKDKLKGVIMPVKINQTEEEQYNL